MSKTKKTTRQTGSRRKQQFLLSEDSPFAVQEAYKLLRTNLIFSTTEDKGKTVLITSSMQGEGKSTTAVNLGIAFAQNHSRVILIDCDLRLPTDASKLKVKNQPGITDVMIGINKLTDAIQHLPTGLDFLAAGTIPPNPTELLGSERMRQILDALSNHYEYIIIDTPPVTTVSDAAILAKIVSGVVIVCKQGVATQESVSETLQKLSFSEAKVLGFVFNGVANEKVTKYNSHYSYSYGYAHAHQNRSSSSSGGSRSSNDFETI